MKAYRLLFTLILSLGSLSCLLNAQTGEPPEPESRMLMQLLRMDDSELTQLRQTIERIEAMSEEERANMRKKLGKLQKMDPEKLQNLRDRIKSIPEEQRARMRQRWFEMSPRERQDWRSKLREMSPEDRASTMEAAGFLPSRPKDRGPANSGPPEDRFGQRPDFAPPPDQNPEKIEQP